MPSPATIEFRRNDRVVVAGDSLVANGLFWPLATLVMNAIRGPQTRAYPGHAAFLAAAPSPWVARTAPPAQTSSGQVWFNSGVGGDDISNILADVPGRITTYSPNVVIIAAGINDQQHFVASGHPTESESAANLDSLLTASKAANPNARHLYVGPVCWGENWAAGTPPTGNNAHDAGIDSMMALLTSVCASQSVCCINLRPQLWDWESVNNPDHLNCTFGGRTLITTDLIHTTNEIGEPWWGARVFERVVIA